MRLTCPACETAYEVPDGAVLEGGRWVRCSACKAEWLARPAVARPAAAPAETPEPTEFEPARPGPSLGATLASEAQGSAGPEPTTAPPQTSPRPADAQLAASFADDAAPSSGGSARAMALIALVTLAALAAVIAYVRHEAIAEAAPALREPLAQYVDWVEGMRAAIREATQGGGA